MVIIVEIWYNISNAKKKDDGSLPTNCYQNGKYVCISLSDQERERFFPFDKKSETLISKNYSVLYIPIMEKS